jgi:hypothetical protein
MINRGLLMPEDERARRQEALYKVVTTHTSHTWAAILVRMLLAQVGSENTAHHTPAMEQETLEAAYKGAKRRLLLFDYDVRVPFPSPLSQFPASLYPIIHIHQPYLTLRDWGLGWARFPKRPFPAESLMSSAHLTYHRPSIIDHGP